MNAPAQEIKELERRRFDAQVHRNFSQLEQLFADDLVYIHSNGTEHDKAEYLESIRDGRSQYGRIVVDSLRVRLYHDNAAVVNGTITISAPDGSAPFRLKYVTVHSQHPQHGWQVVQWLSQRQAD